MQLIDQTCPHCGGTLDVNMQQGKAKCPYCKSQFMIKRTGEKWVVDHSAVMQIAEQNQKNHQSVIRTLGAIILMIGLLIVSFLFFVLEPAKKQVPESTQIPLPTYSEQPQPVAKEDTLSENMKGVIEAIFNKPFDKTSAEEIDSIKYLSMSESFNFSDTQSSYDIVYSFEDYFNSEDKVQYFEKLDKVSCDQKEPGVGFKKSDFAIFTGLTFVDCTYFDEEILMQFKNIRGICININDLNLLAEYVDQNKIVDLRIGGRLEKIDGISQFSNLQYLSISSSDIKDITELEKCSHLKSLSLMHNRELFDYKVIGRLSGLEALEINAEGIKDASFIKSLPNLKRLVIDDMNINQLEFLEAQGGLNYLSLKDIDKVTDLSPIGRLSKLDTLELDVPTHSMDLSSLGNLSQLRKLSVYYAYGDVSFSFLKHLVNLREVNISSANMYDGLGVLSNCQSLEKLTLSNISCYDWNFHKLAGLSRLKEFNAIDYDFNADISSLFTLTQLETINLKESSFQADFSLLKNMVNLKNLYLDHVKIYTNVYVESDAFSTSVWYDDLLLQDQLPQIASCKSLKNLTLSDNELTDISYFSNLTNLESLDITGNYIDDVSSLSSCNQLIELKAKDNLVEDWSPVAHVRLER